MVLLGIVAELVTLPGVNDAFLLFAAGRVLDGFQLYVDLIEINPPLVVALNFPAILVARALGISDLLVFRLGVVLVLGLSLGASQVGLRAICERERVSLRRFLTLVLVFVVFLLPGDAFTEREHLILALVLPYMLVVIARAMDRAPTGRALHLVGVMGGVGFALKPQFVLLWVALEMWLFFARRAAPRIRTESAWVILLLVSYPLLVVWLAPAYLAQVGDLAALYLQFERNPLLVTLLFTPGARLSLFAVLTYLALKRATAWPIAAQGLAVALAALLLIATIQQKGWAYHFYTSLGVAVLLLAVLVATVRRPVPPLAPRVYFVVTGAVLIATVAGSALFAATKLADPRGEAVEPYSGYWDVADMVRQRGERVRLVALSHTMASGWPLAYSTGAEWSMRFPSLWWLMVLYADQLAAPPPLRYPEVSPLERKLRTAVVDDIVAARPDLLVVLAHARDLPENGTRRFDYLAYLSRDVRFREELRHYRYLTSDSHHDIYERLPAAHVRAGPLRPEGRYAADIKALPLPNLQIALFDSEVLVNALVFLIAAGLLMVTRWDRGPEPARG